MHRFAPGVGWVLAVLVFPCPLVGAELVPSLGADGRVRLSWTDTVAGLVLETSTDPGRGPWTPFVGAEASSVVDGSRVITTDLRASVGARFYRLREQSAVSPSTKGRAYDIGEPVWTDLFVDAVAGDDDRDGATRDRAFRTLEAAWRSLPEGDQRRATRIRLVAGTHRGAYLEDRRGTQEFPVLIEPADGPGTVVFRPTPEGDAGSLQFLHCSHVYLQDFAIQVDGGDGLHWEGCDHVLARRMRVRSRRSEGQDETVKANQCRHVYIEDCDIADAGDNCVDIVASQHGHIVRCKIHNSTDWGAYIKGGSAYWVVEGNEIFGCGTGGFTAGQGTGFQFMVSPWLHHEAYGIQVIDNVIHDCEGAGLGVNGGYNILMAHNTLYRVGSRSHLVEFVHGRRGCDGGAAADCQPYLDLGGWGSTGEEEGFIPNRNVQFIGNLIYNPPGFRSAFQHFQIAGPVRPPAGSNAPDPSRADDHLVIRGNVLFNGPADMLLGIESDGDGCQDGDCTEAKLRAENVVNGPEPRLVDPENGDFRPVPGGWVSTLTTPAAQDFSWDDAPVRPAIPPGATDNMVLRDYSGALRPRPSPPGALLP